MGKLQNYKEERLNVLTHVIGVVASVFGLYLLLHNLTVPKTSLADKVGIWIYGGSLIFLYTCSSIYHFVRSDQLKKNFRILDHISIYVLIAGTYTPICISVLNQNFGNLLLIAVWSIAGIGGLLKLFFTGKYEKFSLILYLVMGWLIILDIEAVIDIYNTLSLWLLIGGGLAYSIGIVFYIKHSLAYHHVIWHLFVLLGSLLHYLMIYNMLKPHTYEI